MRGTCQRVEGPNTTQSSQMTIYQEAVKSPQKVYSSTGTVEHFKKKLEQLDLRKDFGVLCPLTGFASDPNTNDSQPTMSLLSVRPNDPPAITILNEPFRRHYQHPINKALRLTNEFCAVSMLKAAARGQINKAISFDVPQIMSLARQLKIEVPKNLGALEMQALFKSKQFIVHAKAQILQRLNSVVNKENDMELNFERSLFQFYKCYIGRGNNAPLIV